MVLLNTSAVDSGMRHSWADEFRRDVRTPECSRSMHGECPHMLGYGGGFNPSRLRFESGLHLCACDCHALCPVTITDNRISVPARVWHESCSCPGAEAARTSLDQAGIEFPDFDKLWAESRQQSRSKQEAFRAVRAQSAGKSREEIKELYVAELRSRGLEIPPEEVLDAHVAAVTGNYLPTARLVGQFVVNTAKFLRAIRAPR